MSAFSSQRRLKIILNHLHPPVNSIKIIHCSVTSTSDEEEQNDNISSSNSTAIGVVIANDFKTDQIATLINKEVTVANKQLQHAVRHKYNHGHNAEIYSKATFNIDAIQKGNAVRANLNNNYHGAADILLKQNGKTVGKVQVKCTKIKSYAKNAAKNPKYDGMDIVVNTEMADIKNANLKSNIKYENVKSKTFSHKEMIENKDMNKYKTSKTKIKQSNTLKNVTNTALISGGVSGILSVANDLYHGEKDKEDIIKDGVKATAKGAIIGIAVSTLEATTGTGPTALIMVGYEISKDAIGFAKGDVSGKDLAKTMAITSTRTVGATTGGYVGAMVGSIIPGPGTVVGGLVGSFAGGVISNMLTSKL